MTRASSTPRELGYRMPAEWTPHAATWLSWPRPDGVSFPDRYDEVLPTFGEIVRALAPHEPVHINVRDDAIESIARRAIGEHEPNVFYHRIPSYEPWCRDHGPIFVARGHDLAVVDWRYNAYGNKYRLHDDDDAVPQRVAELLGLDVFSPGIVLEGGSIDANGAGTLLTTTSVLLNPNRNPQLTQPQIEQYLRDYLGVSNILWLGNGIAGDDTDGHVDDLTRFVNPTTIVTALEHDPHDVNYTPLQENLMRLKTMRDQDGRPLRIVELPMPGVVEYRGQRLPASYANFYIANHVVLLPTYRNPSTDKAALDTLQHLFPDRRVIGIDSTNLIWGLGSFHCLTQQQPAA
ncbi:MAG TPA: agmatine deiminase family protein [Verrucomicrobiae bacterium]|nr:agmatine deiminase family protein [Verrucomicrobiae bacterium]